jgi:NADPH:quinone reductase-like Zn-dependent oxidoreductase
MKAIAHDRYGPPQDVLALREVDRPAVEPDGVLVRVRSASVNPADWHLVRGEPSIARLQWGLRAPKNTVPGCDLAGQVEAVGENVTSLQPGDEVYGSPFMRGFGAFAEYASIPDEVLGPKPANLSFQDAAAVPVAGLTALQGVRDHGRVEPGHRVLIVGASGGVGTFAVQIAKHLGAEVTGVCGTRNLDMVRSLGADHVIDYTREDFTRSGQHYDLVLQLAGKRSASELRRALKPDGTLLLSSGESSGRIIGPLGRVFKARALAPFVGQRMVSFTVSPNRPDLETVKELVEAGEVSPVIDRSYSLSEVPEAVAYLEEGHARGKVVISDYGRASSE